jgi:hypothetical protein
MIPPVAGPASQDSPPGIFGPKMSDEQSPDNAPPDHDPWEHVPQRTHRPWWFWLATGFGGLVLFLSACFVALYYI